MQRMVEKHKRLERIENLKQEKQQLQKQLQAKQAHKANEQSKFIFLIFRYCVKAKLEVNKYFLENSKSENLDKMSSNDENETHLNTHTKRTIEANQSRKSLDQISNIIDTPVQSQYNCKNFIRRLYFIYLLITARLNAKSALYCSINLTLNQSMQH